VAAADVVEAHHIKTIGIDWFTRTDTLIPPAGLFIPGAVVTGGMVIAAQGVTHEHGVTARLVQFSIGFVYQLVVR
jgi:hypothetical protein